MKFKNYVLEDIKVQDNKLLFNYNKNKSSKDGIGTTFGKGKFVPYLKKDSVLDGKSVYSVYNGGGAIEILKALKKKNDIRFEDEDYNYFINRTAMYLAKIIQDNNIQVIMSPKSSSNLVADVMNKIQEKVPEITFFTSVFEKVSMEDIKNIHLLDNPKITDKIRKRFENIKKAAIEKEYFAMVDVAPKFRQFVRGFFENINPKIIKACQDKNVALFDDIITSGTTIAEMLRMIGAAGAKEVTGLTIFKA